MSKLKNGAVRLKKNWPLVLQAALAASIAWLVDTRLVGHPQPFFAPAAAVIVLVQARGQRNRRVFEILLGVAVGVLVGDLLVRALGPQSTITIFAVIFCTLAIAVALGAGNIAMVQGSVSAIYLVVVPPPTYADVPFRFVDALIGGTVALIISQLSALYRPLAPVGEASRKVFSELAEILTSTAKALGKGDEAAARDALTRARKADTVVSGIDNAIAAAHETVWVSVEKRRRESGIGAVQTASPQLDYFVRNSRVLARAGVALLRQTKRPWPELEEAVMLLAEGVRVADEVFAAALIPDPAAVHEKRLGVEELVKQSLAKAAELFTEGQSLPVIMVIGQLRSTALDLLRLVGSDDMHSLAVVDAAVGMSPD